MLNQTTLACPDNEAYRDQYTAQAVGSEDTGIKYPLSHPLRP